MPLSQLKDPVSACALTPVEGVEAFKSGQSLFFVIFIYIYLFNVYFRRGIVFSLSVASFTDKFPFEFLKVYYLI